MLSDRLCDITGGCGAWRCDRADMGRVACRRCCSRERLFSTSTEGRLSRAQHGISALVMVRFAAVVASFCGMGIPDAGIPAPSPAPQREWLIATVECQI